MDEAQYGLAQIIRPDLPTMKAQYQGKSNLLALAAPGVRDASAGKPGYSNNLLAGVTVPFGAKLHLWLPAILRSSSNAGAASISSYAYRLIWRMRNVSDFQNQGIPYHFRGSPKVDSVAGTNLNTIPAAVDCGKAVPPPEALLNPGVSLGALSEQEIMVTNVIMPDATVARDMRGLGGGLLTAPLFLDGAVSVVEQAINNQVNALEQALVTFNPIQVTAQGDELIILINSLNKSTWDFKDPEADKPLYDMLDLNPEFGIYLVAGTGGVNQTQNTYTPVIP
jgi:hypothetical protein